MDKEISVTVEELTPLTTGLILEVKRRRSQGLRDRVVLRKKSAIRIQALWRGSLTRMALLDPDWEWWIEGYDPNEADQSFFLNLSTNEKRWTVPLAFRYFGTRHLDKYLDQANLLGY